MLQRGLFCMHGPPGGVRCAVCGVSLSRFSGVMVAKPLRTWADQIRRWVALSRSGMAMFGAQTEYLRWFPGLVFESHTTRWHLLVMVAPCGYTLFESGTSTTNPTLSRQSAMSRLNQARNPSGGWSSRDASILKQRQVEHIPPHPSIHPSRSRIASRLDRRG
jgi:hypothetical protein